jgi:L-rhamnose mutarotase
VGQVCFVLRLRAGTEAEYDRRHAEVWPELTAAIRDAGIRRHAVFRRGSDVFAFADCEGDGREAFRRLASTQVHAAWRRSMAHLIEAETDETGELLYAPLVWELEQE